MSVTITISRRLALPCLLALMAVTAPAALAHHGWSWADDAQSTLRGRIERISMAPPHPTLWVKGEDGQSWQVDLGNPRQTERSGFTGQTAKAGDAIVVLGNRNADRQQLHMKAVRITLDGKDYDMYPERIK